MFGKDIITSNNKRIPFFVYLSEQEEELCAEEFLYKYRKACSEYEKYIEENTPRWRQEGAQKRKRREDCGISRRELSEKMGVSEQTIAKFERGEPVRSRRMFSVAYDTAIDLILLEREQRLLIPCT